MMLLIIVLYFCLGHVFTAQRQSSYLIDLDSSWNSNDCSTLVHRDHRYRIPRPCHSHLLCSPSSCDDPSFRCVKLRETLCCVQRFIRRSCPVEDLRRLKERFRSFYFDVSIEHGYCEINLERIEQDDRSYCIASVESSSLTWRVASRTNRSSARQRDWILFGRHLTSSSLPYRSPPHLTVFLLVVCRVYLFAEDTNV